MPTGGQIGSTQRGEPVQLTEPMYEFIAGLEDVSGRVAASLDPSTATIADLINALKSAKLMKS